MLHLKKLVNITLLASVLFSPAAMAQQQSLSGTSQASANPLPLRQANSFQINDVIITSPASIVGKWKGFLYPEGDDTSTVVEMVINPGTNQQGTWKFIGNDDYPILDSGPVVASLSPNKATLEFKQQDKKPSWFYKCQLQNNKKLSCEQVGNTDWKLTLNKAN